MHLPRLLIRPLVVLFLIAQGQGRHTLGPDDAEEPGPTRGMVAQQPGRGSGTPVPDHM